MKNKKYQLFCMLLSGSMVVASPAALVLAATQTSNTAIVAEVQQETDKEWDNDALSVGSYTIKQAEITQAMFDDIADQPYTGQAIKPEITSSKLVSGIDYMVGCGGLF